MQARLAASLTAAALLAGHFFANSSAQAQSVSAAPTLSGEAPLAKVGDTWRWVRRDRRTGLQEWEGTRTLKAVTPQRIEATETEGPAMLDAQLSTLENASWKREPAARIVDFPLSVGKKWKFQFVQTGKTQSYKTRWEYEAEVVGIEKVKVAAGEFEAFKIVYRGYFTSLSSQGNGSAELVNWYAPAARSTVRTEFRLNRNDTVTELMELKLQP